MVSADAAAYPKYFAAKLLLAIIAGISIPLLGFIAIVVFSGNLPVDYTEENERIRVFSQERGVFLSEAKVAIGALGGIRAKTGEYPSVSEFQGLIKTGSLKQPSIGLKRWSYGKYEDGTYRLDAPMNSVHYPTFFYESKSQYFGGDF